MSSLLDRLHAYHQLTVKLYHFNQQAEGHKRRAAAQERKLAEQHRQIEALREDVRRAQAAAAEVELDFKSREATLDRMRGQLNTAKTNKEYTTLLREINSFKADSSRLEELALRRLTDVDELKARLAEVQKQAEHEQRRLEELRQQAEARQREVAGQVEEVIGQRRAMAAELPAELVKQFERLAAGHEGEAMAPIVRSHPKREEYICGGCNMGVTLEQVNALRSRDDIQTCNCCGRLLYLGESAVRSSG